MGIRDKLRALSAWAAGEPPAATGPIRISGASIGRTGSVVVTIDKDWLRELKLPAAKLLLEATELDDTTATPCYHETDVDENLRIAIARVLSNG